MIKYEFINDNFHIFSELISIYYGVFIFIYFLHFYIIL